MDELEQGRFAGIPGPETVHLVVGGDDHTQLPSAEDPGQLSLGFNPALVLADHLTDG